MMHVIATNSRMPVVISVREIHEGHVTSSGRFSGEYDGDGYAQVWLHPHVNMSWWEYG